MYNVAKNNFYKNEKNATIYTPKGVSEFLFELLHDKIAVGSIVDPCVGAGSLLYPFKNANFDVIGFDIDDQEFEDTKICNFLAINKGDYAKPALIIANPPFNIDYKTKNLAKKIVGARPLLPEVWLKKIIELWGKEVPICLFAPYGLRLNQTLKSKRWMAFTQGLYPPISTIVSLPKNIYKNVLFHSEVLIFNIKGLEGHYFYNCKL